MSVFTVRDAVFRVMRDFGGDRIFGNPGSTELPMFRDFPQDFTYVLGLQEAVVVGMADGYAQASGKIAFVNLHSAAGVGNAMGNIYTAMKNRAPLVIIAGQQSRSILPFDPYLASEGASDLPKPHVKWAIEPARAEDVPMAVATACHRALQAPCGPVVVSVPSDDWDRPASRVPHRIVSYRSGPDPVLLDRAARILSEAERPALVIGAEVDRDGGWDDLVRLADRHDAAVYTAPMSARASFPEDHPLFRGFLPAVRAQIVQTLAGHDLIAVIGAPVFSYHVEGEGPHLPPGASLIHITNDAAAAARAPTGLSVISDTAIALRDLLRGPPPVPRRRPVPRPEAADEAPSSPMTTAFVLRTLAALRDPEDFVVEEAPTARVVMHDHLPITRPGTFVTMASGGLGYGMPAAAGVAMARPDRRVVCVIGDGSSMYSIQAVWTAVQHRLNVAFLILNNQRYGAMKRFGTVLGFPKEAALPGTDLPGLDFVDLAKGQGCPGSRVTDPTRLRVELAHALQTEGPYLLDVRIA